jgi:hypothetical protein
MEFTPVITVKFVQLTVIMGHNFQEKICVLKNIFYSHIFVIDNILVQLTNREKDFFVIFLSLI